MMLITNQPDEILTPFDSSHPVGHNACTYDWYATGPRGATEGRDIIKSIKLSNQSV